MSYIPKFFFAATLIFIAFDLMLEWIVFMYWKLLFREYCIVLGSFVLIVGYGLQFGMLLSILLAGIAFVWSYSRTSKLNVQVITQQSNMLATTEDKIRQKQAHREIRTLTLHGFIFFGSAKNIVNDVLNNVNVHRSNNSEECSGSSSSSSSSSNNGRHFFEEEQKESEDADVIDDANNVDDDSGDDAGPVHLGLSVVDRVMGERGGGRRPTNRHTRVANFMLATGTDPETRACVPKNHELTVRASAEFLNRVISNGEIIIRDHFKPLCDRVFPPADMGGIAGVSTGSPTRSPPLFPKVIVF